MFEYRLFKCLAISSLLAVAPASALAQQRSREGLRDPDRWSAFGDPRQVVISSDAALVIQHSSTDTTTIQIAPAADFFVLRGLSIGGFVGFDYSKTGSSDATRFAVGPRIGYNIPWSETISFWPKVGFSYSHSRLSTGVPIANRTAIETTRKGDAVALNLFLPMLLHPARHFFAGFGPFLDAELSGDNKVTTYGGKLTVGGWLDL